MRIHSSLSEPMSKAATKEESGHGSFHSPTISGISVAECDDIESAYSGEQE